MLVILIATALIAAHLFGSLPFWVIATYGSFLALANAGCLVTLIYTIGLHAQSFGEASAEVALEKFANAIAPWPLMGNMASLALFAYVATGLWVVVPVLGLICGSVMIALSMKDKG